MLVGDEHFDVPSSPDVTATIEGTVHATSEGHTITFSTSSPPDDFEINGSTITLLPSAEPSGSRLYKFTINLNEGFTFIGVMINAPSDGPRGGFVFAGSGSSMVLHLFYNLPPGQDPFSLGLAVGVRDSNQLPHWIGDPTITFEPQGNTNHSR